MGSNPSSDSHALDVRLLGDVRVERNGERLPGFDSPRLQRLLAYLSLSDGQNRAHLAFELWPNSTESQALGNLRKLLHDLRRELPDADRFLEISQQTIRWRAGGPYSVDLLSFRRLLAGGELARALAHYRGDLLPASYDDRIVAERDRLRAEAVGALLELASSSLVSGNDERAVLHARRALGIDNLCEPAYRILMTASARRGDRAEAFRTYHRCAEVLRRELDVEPDPRTRAVYDALGATASAATPMPQFPSSRLVGRSSELSRSAEVWRRSAEGRPQLLLVTGEPGIGKTRLVEELASMAAVGGSLVARARAYQSAGRPPWGPVIEWLRSPALEPSLSRLEPVWLAELARLLPELRTADSGPDLPPVAGDAGRHRLFDAIGRALLAGSRPLLLVVDDLQWCDRETLQLVGHLLLTASGAPLLVAATMRSDEVDEGDAVGPLKSSLSRDDLLTEIDLGRLDAGSTGELASGLLGRHLDSDDVDRLWRDTEGQPLFIVEAARTGLGPAGPENLSRTVRSVISSRLGHLSPRSRRLVEVAATVGRSFSVEVLAAASGFGEDALVDGLDEAWRRQILREQGDGYDFSHDRIREVAYDAIPPARRRALHRAVAAALESARAETLEPVSSLLAGHYEAAGMLEEAVAAYQRSGRRSVEVFALEDAIGAYRHAVMLLERLPAGPAREERELELRMALGIPLVAREGYGSDAVQDSYSRAMALCERLGRRVEPPVLRGLGLASLMSCRFDRSERFGELLAGHADHDPTAAVEGHYLLGVASFWRGDLNTACEHLQAAIDRFDPKNAGIHLRLYGQDPRAVCLVRLAVAELWRGRPEVSRALARESVRYAASLDHPTTEGYVRMYTAMLAAERDEIPVLRDEVGLGEAIWSERRLGYFQRVGLLMRSWLGAVSGDESEEQLKGVLDGWRFESQTLHFTYGLTLLARLQVRRGDAAAGRASVAEAIQWTAEHDQGYLGPELLRLEGELWVLGGEERNAIDSFERALVVAREQGSRWFELKAACSLARHRPGPASRSLVKRVLPGIEGGADLALLREAHRVAAGH